MKPVVTGLFHVAIKTRDLDATKKFWLEVLGLADIARPDFGYPGAWFAVPTPSGTGIIHIYAGGPALAQPNQPRTGTAVIDHISLTAVGYHAFRARFSEFGYPFREFLVPGTTLYQLFVYDPNGVQLELTFDGRVEDGALPDMSPGRGYVAGQSFFVAEAPVA